MPDLLKINGLYFILVALVGTCLMPVRMYIRFYREPNVLTVYSHLLFWIVPLRINLVNPVSKIVWNLSVNRPWRKKPPLDVRGAEVGWLRLFIRMNSIQKISRQIWRSANRFFMSIGKPIRLKELNLYTEIALGDAARTGVAAGAAWAAQGLALARLAQIFNARDSRNRLIVVPDYTSTNFLRVDYSCIFQFRLGHIIIIIYQIFKNAGEIYNLIRRAST